MINFIMGILMMVAVDLWFDLSKKESFFSGMLIFMSLDVYMIKKKLEEKAKGE